MESKPSGLWAGLNALPISPVPPTIMTCGRTAKISSSCATRNATYSCRPVSEPGGPVLGQDHG
jgi:hypothetical protein